MDNAVPSWHSPARHHSTKGCGGHTGWHGMLTLHRSWRYHQGGWDEGWHGQATPCSIPRAPHRWARARMLRGATSAWPSHARGWGHEGQRRDSRQGCTPTPSDAIWIHSSLQSQEGEIQPSTGKKHWLQPQGSVLRGAEHPEPGKDFRRQSPPPVTCRLRPRTGHGRFRCLRIIGAVVPAGHASRCCQLPATGSALTWEKRIQTRSLTLQTPSASHHPPASDAGGRGPATTRDGPSHTAPGNNFSSVPGLAREPPRLGGAFRALKSPCVCLPHA